MTTLSSTSPVPAAEPHPRSPRSSMNPDRATTHASTTTGSPPQPSTVSRTPSLKSVQSSSVPPSSSSAGSELSHSMPKKRDFWGREEPTPPMVIIKDEAPISASSADEMTAIVRREGRKGKRYYLGVGGGSPATPAATPSSTATVASKGSVSGTAKASQDHGSRGSEGWFKRFVDKYGSVELDNKGSVARDHLALGELQELSPHVFLFPLPSNQLTHRPTERTFLAWLRTSLAFASIGIAITQLFRLNTTLTGDMPPTSGAQHLKQVGKPLGATFLAIAIVVLFIGFHRYFESQYWIIKGKFPASRGGVAAVTVVAGLLMVVSLVVVLAIGGKAFEK